jgi:predicted site-specific integrase-resolvase
MLLEKSWFTLEEAESKFGVEKKLILEWVKEGIVRCETEGETVARVNADDLELKLGERLQTK